MQKQYKFYIKNGKAIVHPIGGGNIGPIQAHRDVRAVSIQAQGSKVLVTYEDGAVMEHPWPNTGGSVVYLVQPQNDVSWQKNSSQNFTFSDDEDDDDDDGDDCPAFEHGHPPLVSPTTGPILGNGPTTGPILAAGLTPGPIPSVGPILGPIPSVGPTTAPILGTSEPVEKDKPADLWTIFGGVIIWSAVIVGAWYAFGALPKFDYKVIVFLVCTPAVAFLTSRILSDIVGRLLKILIVLVIISGALFAVYSLLHAKAK